MIGHGIVVIFSEIMPRRKDGKKDTRETVNYSARQNTSDANTENTDNRHDWKYGAEMVDGSGNGKWKQNKLCWRREEGALCEFTRK